MSLINCTILIVNPETFLYSADLVSNIVSHASFISIYNYLLSSTSMSHGVAPLCLGQRTQWLGQEFLPNQERHLYMCGAFEWCYYECKKYYLI